ncbi:DUF6090 family protein [Romboutsia sp.]|uniref:DUF6090 family protein n=1 Tax=Romboutsia sp. TaxID=1965302 RepID=UPI002D80EA5A|nr:DUF6090 family protein [Romboutsia sp.]
MAKLFNKIRRQLVSEEPSARRTSNYLKYAIGEIVLVMIGILLALQINNWNEQKKSDRFELKMLKEIKTAIEDDNTYLQKLLDTRIKDLDSFCKVLMNMLKQDHINPDEFNKYALKIGFGFVFQYSDGAYEALKASGIDKVTNDSLRNELIHFYDFVGPRTTKLINYVSGENSHQNLDDLKWQIFEYDVVQTDNSTFIDEVRYKLEDYKDERFLRYLDSKSNEARNGQSRISGYIRVSKEVLELLDKELNKRSND